MESLSIVGRGGIGRGERRTEHRSHYTRARILLHCVGAADADFLEGRQAWTGCCYFCAESHSVRVVCLCVFGAL